MEDQDRKEQRWNDSNKTQKRGTQQVIHTIHGGFARGEDTMASQKKHTKKDKVTSVRVMCVKVPKLSQTPEITFTNEEAKGLHMHYDVALVAKLFNHEMHLEKATMNLV